MAPTFFGLNNNNLQERLAWFQPNGPWPGQTNAQTGAVISPFDNSLTPYKVTLARSRAGGVPALVGWTPPAAPDIRW